MRSPPRENVTACRQQDTGAIMDSFQDIVVFVSKAVSNYKKTADKYCAESDACAEDSWCSVSFRRPGTVRRESRLCV
jgi:hypothetical protein